MTRRPTELIERDHTRVDDGGAEQHRFELGVPVDLAVFEGHFAGEPILPAFVILEVVVGHIRRCWPELERWRSSPSMKFKAPIRPGDALELQLHRREGAERVGFAVTAGGKACASGTLVFG